MINYSLIGYACQFYTLSCGFEQIESPWTVTKAIADITRPPKAGEFSIKEKNKVLVASGEQSFLYLYAKGYLPKGKLLTVTPCFRNDDFDGLHTKYFMKVELINTKDVSPKSLDSMIDCAKEFFKQIFPPKGLKVVKISDNQFDIFYKDVELGSYGIRKCDFLEYVYGTGCAEPRTSLTLQKYGLS